MEIVEGHQYRVRENWLYFPDLDLEPVQVPFGLGIGRDAEGVRAGARQRLRIAQAGRQLTSLQIESAGLWRHVLPAFSREVTGKNSAAGFRIEVAITDWQRSMARALVARTHYLTPRSGGFILIACFPEQRAAKRLRAEWWTKQSPKVRMRLGANADLAAGGLGDVVGALHLERLMHGHPRGRQAIYEREGKRAPRPPRVGESEGFRQKVIRDLGLYWISRVAIDAPFQRCGIGSALCDAAREIAAHWMLEPGGYVELIRRMPLSKFEEIKAGESDFLSGTSAQFGAQLPFTLYPDYLSRRPGQTWNSELGRSDLVLPGPRTTRGSGDCLAYYHAKAGPMVIGAGSTPNKKGRKR